MYVAQVVSNVSAPPSFMRLAGHPLRWRLLGELARSDRRVRELVSLVGEPQNLVSYHLGRLRAGRLVAARRSTSRPLRGERLPGRPRTKWREVACCASPRSSPQLTMLADNWQGPLHHDEKHQ